MSGQSSTPGRTWCQQLILCASTNRRPDAPPGFDNELAPAFRRDLRQCLDERAAEAIHEAGPRGLSVGQRRLRSCLIELLRGDLASALVACFPELACRRRIIWCVTPHHGTERGSIPWRKAGLGPRQRAGQGIAYRVSLRRARSMCPPINAARKRLRTIEASRAIRRQRGI
jgi:hypothetical protein